MFDYEKCSDWQNEQITRTAIHEAGHFVMIMLLTKHAPFRMEISPETGCGATFPVVLPDKLHESGLILFAGYAAEKNFDGGDIDSNLGQYMNHEDYDFQDFLNECREYCGQERLTEGFFTLALEIYKAAQSILRPWQKLILALATELKFEPVMDYEKIKGFCHDFGKEFPILTNAVFDQFSMFTIAKLNADIQEYHKDLQTVLCSN